jgi:hypothetical protein
MQRAKYHGKIILYITHITEVKEINMRKFTIQFNKIKDILDFKKIMTNVYSGISDHLPDIVKFCLNKNFVPSRVDRAELEVETVSGKDTITISKGSLTFFKGEQHPFSKVAANSEDEAKYIVLPWSLNNQVGRDNLKNLISRIPTNTKVLKYIVYINDSNLNQSSASLAGLNLTNIVAEDETEGLIKRIDKLKDADAISKEEIAKRDSTINEKQRQIDNLNTQIANLQTTMQAQAKIQAKASSNTSGSFGAWKLVAPKNLTGSVVPLRNGVGSVSIGGPVTTITDWNNRASIANAVGNIILDVANRTLTIGGNSCGRIEID